jgi:hypothetical protein
VGGSAAALHPFCSVELVKEHLKNRLGILVGAGYIFPSVEAENLGAVPLNPNL